MVDVVSMIKPRSYLLCFSLYCYSAAAFPCCTVRKAVTMHSPHLKIGELCLTSLMVENQQKLFGILLDGRFVCFPWVLKIYSIIYLYHHELIDIYFLLWVDYNQILFFKFVVWFCPALTTESAYIWLLCLFDIPHFLKILLCFLELEDAQGISLSA